MRHRQAPRPCALATTCRRRQSRCARRSCHWWCRCAHGRLGSRACSLWRCCQSRRSARRRAGLRVVVIDKASFPRDKCCGDGLTTGALRLLEQLGLPPASVPSWTPCRDVTLRSPSGRTIDLQLPAEGQFAAIATRFELDNALVQHARSLGIDVREATEFLHAAPTSSIAAPNAA
ncbi:MAG: hypothetical protein EBY04_04125, partial [Actinobacteria bacterium]|nr:hypothetical protein [Actinomycetota bacterium]